MPGSIKKQQQAIPIIKQPLAYRKPQIMAQHKSYKQRQREGF